MVIYSVTIYVRFSCFGLKYITFQNGEILVGGVVKTETMVMRLVGSDSP